MDTMYVCMYVYVCLQQSSLQPALLQSPVYSTTSLVANKVKCLVCVQLGNVYYWVMVVYGGGFGGYGIGNGGFW